MNEFWAGGPNRYANGLNAEHGRRRAELLAAIKSAETDEDRDRLRLQLKSLAAEYAERHSKIGRSLF